MRDTFRLKFPYDKPDNIYFSEGLKLREIVNDNNSNRYVFSNNSFRKKRKKQRLYTPKYWIEQHYLYPDRTYFVIEFSAGKLIRETSLRSVEASDFQEVVQKLRDFLSLIGVHISKAEIRNNIPLAFATGKNIDITKVSSCHLAISAISDFNDRYRSNQRIIHFNEQEFGGDEIYFGNKETSFKIYSKIPEVANNAITNTEFAIAARLKTRHYGKETTPVKEILRFELTLRNKKSVRQKMKYILDEGKEPTFENIFTSNRLEELLKKEVEQIYNHSLKHFIFLANENAPVIQAILDKSCKSIHVKDYILILLQKIQTYGVAGARRYVNTQYKSKKTWYNYLRKIEKISREVDVSKLRKVTSVGILDFILSEFGICYSTQDKLL